MNKSIQWADDAGGHARVMGAAPSAGGGKPLEKPPARAAENPDFEQEVLAHREALAVQARNLCRSRVESEDLFQEVVI